MLLGYIALLLYYILAYWSILQNLFKEIDMKLYYMILNDRVFYYIYIYIYLMCVGSNFPKKVVNRSARSPLLTGGRQDISSFAICRV